MAIRTQKGNLVQWVEYGPGDFVYVTLVGSTTAFILHVTDLYADRGIDEIEEALHHPKPPLFTTGERR